MRTTPQKNPRATGSTLVVALIIAAILCLSLLSYLGLVHQQNLSVARSQNWNAALAHAEAGVEEAMAQLNYKFGDTNISSRSANGWGGPAGGFFGPVNRTLLSGSYSAIISADPLPIIYSTGYAAVPIKGAVLKRTVEVKTAYAPAFQVGMAAKLNIVFKGNNITTDSYDSADPAHDNPLDPNEVKANGDVASTEGLVQVQNANIHGKIRTGPYGSFTMGPNGFAGPIGWNGPGLYSPDWYQNDFNYEFKDVLPPDTTGWLPFPSPVSGTNYDYVLSGNYYVNGDLKLTGKTIYVPSDTQLYVTGSFDMLGPSQLNIAWGARVEVYVGTTSGPDTSATFAQVNAVDGNAAAFAYYGLPSNKSATWNGNDTYRGTFYAPEAVFTLGGGGPTPYDYMGACVVSQVVMNGIFRFHYDENLRKRAKVVGYTVGSWREL